jgi:hypothetical protein
MSVSDDEEDEMRVRNSRRLIVAAGLAAAVVFANGLCAAKTDAAAEARAVFGETAFDFGKVKQGDVLTHEFVFRNSGSEALVVQRVDTTCGCTAALVSADKIGPGREGKIKVSMDTHGYAGRMTRYVYLFSNDAKDSRRELSVSADIEVPPMPKIDIDKYNIDLGLSLEGETPAAKVLIKNVGERELSVEMAHQEIRFFSGGRPLSFPLLIPAGQSAEVELRFAPQQRTGALRDYVLIRSNDSIRSTLSVYISRYVVTRAELKELFRKYRSIIDDRR